ncbi:MAG: ATP-binding protein [Thermoplasmata archaeon]|nr:ATP-binding protein [Thermoplasmata archaeon]
MTYNPPALERALGSLLEGAGRTVVLSGPPGSAKTEILGEIRERLSEIDAALIEVRGVRDERAVGGALVSHLWDAYRAGPVAPLVPTDDPSEEAEAESPAPTAVRGGTPRRGRRGSSPARAALAVSADEFWARLTKDLHDQLFEGPLVLLIDDAVAIDHESREFLLLLAERIRWRPVLLLLSLDSGSPAVELWNERLVGRPDVEWIPAGSDPLDPAEAQRARAAMKGLPLEVQSLIRTAILLEGQATSITLSRAEKISPSQTAEAIRKATNAKVLRLREDKVGLVSERWGPAILEGINPEERRQLHSRIASALLALHPEPTLDQRVQIARHKVASRRDAETLWFLNTCAEELEKAGRFDEAVEMLDGAILCSADIAGEARLGIEASIRVLRTRVLVFTGRLESVERELRESLPLAIQAHLNPERIEDLAAALLPALRVAGPRPALLSDLAEIADRLRDAGAPSAELCVTAALTELHFDQGRIGKARSELVRVLQMARPISVGPGRAMVLITAAGGLLMGDADEREVASKCMDAARALLAGLQRPRLQLYADEIDARILASRGERNASLAVLDRAILAAEKNHLRPSELLLRLDAIELLFQSAADDSKLGPALERARFLADTLRLLPPSPALLHLLLLEGRWASQHEDASGACDRWIAVADLTAAYTPLPLRSEAWLRLAELAGAAESPPESKAYRESLGSAKMRQQFHAVWTPRHDALAGPPTAPDRAAEPQ